jgi:hypothetical protein
MKSITNVFISAALLLSPAVKGQQIAPPQAQATGQQPQSDRLEDDPGFKRLSPEQQEWIKAQTTGKSSAKPNQTPDDAHSASLFHVERGRKIGDHTFTEATLIDGSVHNSVGEVAFVARWLDTDPGSGIVYSAVFTSKRCVAWYWDNRDDGRFVIRILKNSLAINKAGQVAYEALYANNIGEAVEGIVHRGVFVEQRFAFELDPNKLNWLHGDIVDTERDFILTDDGKIIPRPAVVLSPPAPTPDSTHAKPIAQSNQAQPSAKTGCSVTPAPANNPSWLATHIRINPPALVQQQINRKLAQIQRRTGITIVPNVSWPAGTAKPKAANTCPPATQTGAPAAPPQ